MVIRKAVFDDLEVILNIYEYARKRMRLSGNPNQWKQNYPPKETIAGDIAAGNSYVITDDKEIVGVFAFIIGEDETYRCIEQGEWVKQGSYGTIHRMAGNGKRTGLFRICEQFCESRISNIRADTHADNAVMQHLLEENGYQKCGRIYAADGSPRIAYQKAWS